MPDANDMELLGNYARNGSETAFTELVQRHIALVYSAAFRHVGMAAQAEEITQAVFIVLARKAGALRPDTILEGWLYETTRLTALSFLRGERRRQFREQEAYMQSTLRETNENSAWSEISPLLDEALAHLGKKDRDAVILRFFKEKSVRDVAATMQMKEAATQRRLLRALEKLRKFFAKRGVASTTAIIATAISSNSVQAAPATLAQSVAVMAMAKGATASASTLTLIKGTLKVMAWTKTQTAIVLGVGLLLAAGTATVTIEHVQQTRAEKQWRNPNITSYDLDKLPPAVDILPTLFPQQGDAAGNGHKFVGIDQSVADIVSVAYNWPQARMIFPAGQPAEKYDYVATLAKGSSEALREKLKSKLGLVARPETMNEDVLLLIMQNPNAPGLHPPVPGNTDNMIENGPQIEIKWQNERISRINGYLQSASPLPIIDETHNTTRYSVDITWLEDPNDPEHTALQKVLREQLGLVLVPTNLPVKMLLVQKAN